METESFSPGAAPTEDGQQQLMAAFARLSRTYELILHATSESIFSLDLARLITFANPAAARMLEWPAEDMLGQSVCSVVHGAACATELCLFAGPIRNEVTKRRDVFVTRSGGQVLVEYSLAVIREDDVCLGAVLVVSDITERERAERALKQSNERLSSTREQLLQAEKLGAIGQLAAGVAHQINTPLGFVNANINTLGRRLENLLSLVAAYEAAGAGQADPAVAAARRRCDLEFLREDASVLVAETGSGLATVARIVRELMDFASAGESGEWQWGDLSQLLDAARVAAVARVGGQVAINCDYAGGLPQIYCLATRLGQAFTNILVNALQAVGRNGQIVVRTREGAAGEVEVEIEDDGIGIAAENLSRVRNPFFTTRPVGSGAGMGLSVADTTVRRHGGRLEIASRVGNGSRVTITLPLRPSEA